MMSLGDLRPRLFDDCSEQEEERTSADRPKRMLCRRCAGCALADVHTWAEQHFAALRSEAIRRLVEVGLAAATPKKKTRLR